MKNHLLLLSLLFFTVTNAQIFVNQNATGNNDGTSWANAYTDLKTAISNSTSGDTLWIKTGIYKPGTLRTDGFGLKPNITLLGGFIGNETQANQRDFVHNITVMSGNIGDESTNADNSHHVFNLSSNCSNAKVDGVHICDGNANTSSHWGGGGIYLYNSGTVTFSNCVIHNNGAQYGGAAMTYYNANVFFENVIFYQNTGYYYGAVIQSFSGNPTLINCLVANNTCQREYNGVLETYSQKPFNLYNTTMVANRGNAIKSNAISKVYNSIIVGNTSGSITYEYSYKNGNLVPGAGNINDDILLRNPDNPIGPDSLWFTEDDGLQLSFVSPARNSGSNSLLQSNQQTDILGIKRINSKTVDMGAYEFDSIPTFENQIIATSIYLNSGDTVGEIIASDADGDSIFFKTISGAAPYFTIDEETGIVVVNDISSLDNTITHNIDLTMQVHDPISYKQAIITVKLIPQTPPVINNQSFTLDENSTNGTYVGTITATPGSDTTLTYSILSGNDEGTFAINQNTGQLSIADSTLIDYEKNTKIEIVVTVNDSALNSNAIITVNIIDINEVPIATNYAFLLPSNTENNMPIDTALAYDPEMLALTYSIDSGNSQNIFAINTTSGEISVVNNTLLDLNVPKHQLRIIADDGTNSISYFVTIFVEAPVNPNITYVNQDAFGNNDGSSWFNAYTNLTTAINNSTSGDTIWVKAGVYKPGTLRTDGFGLKPNIALLGGFIGNETQANQRDFVHNITVMSGNIGDESTSADNSHHVLLLTSNCNGAVVNGFHIQEGKAEGSSYYGGGIWLKYAGTVTFTNCVIQNNYGIYGGGVMVDYNSNAIFENVVFANNQSTFGAAIHAFGGNPTLNNCIVYANNSRSDGAAIETYTGHPYLLNNLTMYGNTGGSTIRSTGGGNTKVCNSIIVGNTSGNIIYEYSYKNGNLVSGTGNINDDILLKNPDNPIGPDSLWFTEDDGLQLMYSSPARNSGNNNLLQSSQQTDILGIKRINGKTVDMGAYEFDSIPTFENQIISASTFLDSADFVGRIEASDADEDSIFFKTISGSAPYFTIDEETGIIVVNDISSLDSTKNHIFDILMQVYDPISYKEATVTVKLIPQNPPVINNQNFTIDENPTNGTSVGTITATPGSDTTLTYFILSGNDEGTFAIKQNTGQLSIADSTLIDYEKNTEVEIVVTVNDSTLKSNAIITININDINEAPIAPDYNLIVPIETANNTLLDTIQAFDPENSTLTYSIDSGNSQNIFAINTTTGEIRVVNNTLLDLNVPKHQLRIIADDGINSISYFVHIFVEAPVNPNITYVNQDAFGNNDGSSWFNAYTDLTTAINNSTTGDTLWIKEGKYIANTTVSSGSFRLKSGTAIIGGFAGIESQIDERDFVHHQTIVSGNIGDSTIASDNLYHVFYFHNVSSFLIDGITIQDGYTDDYISGGYSWGGGLFFYYPSTGTVRNCIVKDNWSKSGGAVAFNYNCRVTFENVVFANNIGIYGQAVYLSSTNTALFNNCIFYNNYGRDYLIESGGSATFTNCTLFKNTGANVDFYSRSGGSIFIKNTAFDRGTSTSGNIEMTNCIHPSNTLPGDNNITAGIAFLNENNPIGPDSLWFTEDDGLQLSFVSPARNSGSNSLLQSSQQTDILGNPRSIAIFPDMGAYEFVSAPYFTKKENAAVKHHQNNGDSITSVWAEDYDSETLSFTIDSGNTGNAFSIGTNDGIIKINDSTALDITTNPFFNLKIKVSDGLYYDTTAIAIAIEKANAEIIWDTLQTTYNGLEQKPIAQTIPHGLQIDYAYNDSTEIPVTAGNYKVIATINDAAYCGTDTVTFVINKATLTATVSDTSKVYGETNPEFSINYTGFLNNDNVSNITEPTISCVANGTTAVGDVPITLSGGSAENYDLTLNNGTLSITKATLTVTANDTSKVYGETNPEFSINYIGFLNNDNVSNITEPTISCVANGTTAVGDVPITLSGGSAENYDLTLNNGTLSITKATLIATANDTSKIYGETNPEFSINYTGFLNNDNVSNITEPTISCAANETTAVGDIPITLLGGSADNYNLTLNNGTLSITKATLIATANDTSKIYGETNPAFSINYTGFLNNDNVSNITEPTISCAANETTAVGDIPITLLGGSADNYNLTLYNGTLSITKATLTVTVNDTSKVYGETNPAFSINYTGFLNNDNVSNITEPTISCVANETTAVGDVPITLSGGSADNYNLTLNNGTLSITKATLTAKANDTSKVYGETNPKFSINYTGFLNNDNVSNITEPTISCVANETTAVGDVPITLSGGSADNYDLTLNNGTLSITKATLTATANDTSKVYGETNPAFSINYTGFLNNDNVFNITEPTISCVANKTTNVGNVPITLSGGSADNYDLTLNNGTLSITKATLTATADDTSKVYGETNPAFSINYTGFLNNDNVSNITEPTISCAANETTAVGDVPITLSGGSADNYDLTLNNGTLSITKATLTATADDTSKVYGETNPAFSINYTGFLNNDNVSNITEPTISCAANETTAVGDVPITLSGGSADNYNLTLYNGTLSITKATLTVTVNDTSKVYGETNPAFSINYTGFLNNDNVSNITEPTISCAANETTAVGDVPITLSGGSADNYDLTLNNGTLTIHKANQTEPSVPQLAEKSHHSITLKAIDGCEYSINGEAWQASVIFDGLNAQTEYIFTQRYAETTNYLASAESPQLKVITDAEPINTYSITFNVTDGTNIIVDATIIIDSSHYQTNTDGQAIVENLKSGTYTYIVSATNYTSDTASVTITNQDTILNIILIDESSFVEDIFKNQIKVYPIPADDFLFVKGINETTEVEFFDLSGKKVLHKQINQDINKLDVSKIKEGVYLMKVNNLTVKIIIK